MFRDGLNLLSIFLVGWFVVSLLAFILIGWSFLQNSVYQSGLQAGVDRGVQSGIEQGATQASAQIYTDIINKAANDECNTVFIQYDGRRVDLINVQCLQALTKQPVQDDTNPDDSRG